MGHCGACATIVSCSELLKRAPVACARWPRRRRFFSSVFFFPLVLVPACGTTFCAVYLCAPPQSWRSFLSPPLSRGMCCRDNNGLRRSSGFRRSEVVDTTSQGFLGLEYSAGVGDRIAVGGLRVSRRGKSLLSGAPCEHVGSPTLDVAWNCQPSKWWLASFDRSEGVYDLTGLPRTPLVVVPVGQ